MRLKSEARSPKSEVRLWVLLVVGLFCGVLGCSPGYKMGRAISKQDLVKALPEYWITLPAGATNVYLEHKSDPILACTWYKLTVPRTSLTNFLQGLGFLPDFIPVTPRMLAERKMVSLPSAFPPGLGARDTAAWVSEVSQKSSRAAHWDLEKAAGPLRMYMAARPGMASPKDRVILMGYVDDSSSSQAAVWLEYFRLHQ